MKTNFLKTIAMMVVCAAMLTGCTNEKDYPELIVGKWMQEQHATDDQNPIDVVENNLVWVFQADGYCYMYHIDNSSNRGEYKLTYTVSGKNVLIESEQFSIRIEWTIEKLNKKTLIWYQDLPVINYDSQEIDESQTVLYKEIYSRI